MRACGSQSTGQLSDMSSADSIDVGDQVLWCSRHRGVVCFAGEQNPVAVVLRSAQPRGPAVRAALTSLRLPQM